MHLNVIGEMVRDVWNEIPAHYPGIDIDASVVMPNHFHGIIILRRETETAVGAGPRACPFTVAGPRACPPLNGTTNRGHDIPAGQPQGVAPTAKRLSLPDVVHRFKSLTTARYRHGVKQYAWPDSPGHFWQPNYHEHIIRDDMDLNRIRDYIINNPAQWDRDRFHVDAKRR